MQDKLATIKRIIDEHQTIKRHVKLVGDTLTDREALASLQEARADFIPGRPSAVAEMQQKLQQTVASLEEGLKNHFGFEEKALPPLLGEILTQALILEHREIKKEIDKAKATVAGIKLAGLNREDLLEQESFIHQAIDSICQLVEEHSIREELVLEMIRRALEEASVKRN